MENSDRSMFLVRQTQNVDVLNVQRFVSAV